MTIRVLYIHKERKLKYGAHYINDLIVEKLRSAGAEVDTVYPKESIELLSPSLTGVSNILFFFSLIKKKRIAKQYDIIQGTTYTTLPFLENGTPVISHFGSTTYGFLRSTPSVSRLAHEHEELAKIYAHVKRHLRLRDASCGVKSLRDISNIELHVAKKSTAVIAASERVKRELVRNGVSKNKVHVVHNAIEAYWFRTRPERTVKATAELVYLGRMGDDTFTIRLKGINRLLYVLNEYKQLRKHVIGMCAQTSEYEGIFASIPSTTTYLSMEKMRIPRILKHHYGDLYINPGRYEGFCLSLVEAMSQGLIPITFPVGIAEEVIENGKNGYIVHSIAEMIEKIDYLTARPRKRNQMAREAMRAAAQFHPDTMTKRLMQVYRSVSADWKGTI